MPKVSVIIPTYNLSSMIENTINSVLKQTERDLEVIVVDDGSTDDTRAVIQGIKDGRVEYFYKSNGGTPSARNYGLSKAKGKYIAFLDHDDLWPVKFLKVMISHMEKNKEFDLSYSPITIMYPDGRQIKSYKAPEGKSGWLTIDLFKRGFIWTSAAVIRSSVLKGFYYDESLRKSYEDGDYFLRLSRRTPFLFVPEVEAIRRNHTESLSWQVGIQPTRILVLERFYFFLGGNKFVPPRIAKRKMSHACRKVAKARQHEGHRAAAMTLYKRAIKYCPTDLRLYLGLLQTLLLSKKDDPNPGWQMPGHLPEVGIYRD